MTTMPMSGIRVLDLTRVLAGPFAGQLLADLGAEVIKIERPGVGDEARIFGPPFLKDAAGEDLPQTAMFLSANRNKKSIVIDFSKPEGAALIRDLAAKSDVFLENFKVGDLARFGLDYDSLKAVNPRLVYCSITGFGQTGPYRDRRGYDPIMQAMCGIMSVTGDPDGAQGGGPIKAGPSVTDLFAGCYAVIAVQGALYHRDVNGGLGQHIDIALLDAGVAMMAHPAMHYVLSGTLAGRVGNQANGGVPGGGFQCADGYIMVAPGNNELYRIFCQVLGRPDLATDPRFADNALRVKHRKLLTGILEGVIAEWRVQDLYEALIAAGVPAGPVNDLAQVFADPQVQSRGMVVDVAHPTAGSVRMVANPIRYSETKITGYAAPPGPGEHTAAILGELLGIENADFDRLKVAKVIG